MHDTNTVFAIFDSKAEAWTRPIFSRNEATCQREIREILSRGDTPYSAHPEDYTLFRIGTWSETSPIITYDTAPLSIGCLIQFAPKGTVYGDQLTAA